MATTDITRYYYDSPSYWYATGQTTGTLIKSGEGKLKRLNLSAIAANAAITFYDGLASGTTNMIFQTGAIAANTLPQTYEFEDIQFNTGLFIVKATANSNTQVIYR